MIKDILKIACLQLNSGDQLLANINDVKGWVDKAVRQGADFVATPENTFLMRGSGGVSTTKREYFAQDEHPAVRAASDIAREHKIWLLVGSVLVNADERVHGDKKSHNRSLLFNPEGEIAAQYDKIHLFDAPVGDGQTYRESKHIVAGDKAVSVDTPWEKLGMTICYDLRFPQLYRALAKNGARIITIPAAFTQVTGEAHWHVLLRARAIETGCFIVAPAQTGTHAGGKKTYGHSLIVNPWGEVIADGGTQEGVISAELDLSEVKKSRLRLPSLQHDREFD